MMSQSIYPLRFLEPYLGFTHAQNRGVAFSLFQGWGNVVVIVGITVCILIAAYALRLPAGSRAVRIGLGLILGGALGNIADRLRQGYVTDMIHFRIPQIGFDWPVSNFADVFIFLGVCFLIAASLWPARKSDEKAAPAVAMPAQQEWRNGQ